MISKQEHIHMDVYNERGIKVMDAHGLYDFDDLTAEMLRALANKQIPIVRLASRAERETPLPETEALEAITAEDEGPVCLKWRFDGVEFAAEGPAEYVLRASAELLEHLEGLT